MRQLGRVHLWNSAFSILILFLASCGSDEATTSAFTNCLVSSSWTPSVTGASASNHDGTSSVTKLSLTGSGPIVGLADAIPTANQIALTFSVPSGGLGLGGSISLNAVVSNFPSDLSGSAFPVLVSLLDPNGKEWINLASACNSGGLFTCPGGSCTANSSCTLNSPSAYENRDDWQQHQIGPFGFASHNVFPTCNWTDPSGKECHFIEDAAGGGSGTGFLTSGVLPGGTYTARYALIASNFSAVSGVSADISVTALLKSDSDAADGGLDINVILVGSSNVNAANSTKGQANLNALFKRVHDHYSQVGTGIGLGSIKAYDWDCGNSGEPFANTSTSDLASLFEDSSRMINIVDPSSEGQAVNILFVNTIPFSQSLTILGVAGGINGPVINGTGASGMAVSTFEQMATYNPGCSGSTCADNDQEADFVDLAGTVSHEMGHYIGLNHLSESDASDHDQIPDTPECVASGGNVTKTSCRSTTPCSSACSGTFCPTVASCQFNHVMWYTSKGYNESTDTGDGFLFSTQSSSILNYSPLVR